MLHNCYTQMKNYKEEIVLVTNEILLWIAIYISVMLLTWNGLIIFSRLNAISKDLPPLFYLYFYLAVNIFIWKKILSLTLFKITTVSRSSTLLRVFLMGRPECPTKKKNWGKSPCKSKSLNFPLLLNITPTKKLAPPVPWSQVTYW